MTYFTFGPAHMAEMESNDLEVAVGTYEELILGYHLTIDGSKSEFTQSFTNHSHTGCVKKVAISQNGILASGGTDEAVWLFNLRKRTEIGSLLQHSGTVTWLEFFKNSHMFSTSEDGKLCVWKAFSWECLRTFKGHKGTINCVAVHPSGKMALTVGKDRSLHTWNLVRGRSAFITNIKQAADIVQWSPDGSVYLIVFNNRIDLYKTETASVYHTVNAERRINAVIFLNSDLIAYGGEGGDIIFFNYREGREVHRIDTETTRIRDLAKVETTNKDCPLVVLSASSDGHIKAYKLIISKSSVSADMIASHNTKFRLTCIAAAEIKSKTKVKKEDGVDIKTEIKQEVKSSDEVFEPNHEDSDDDSVEIKEEMDSEDSVEIKEEKSDEEEYGKSYGRSSEADSGLMEDSTDSDSSQEVRKSRKTSFLEFKKAQKLKRRMKEEEKKKKEKMKKRKKEKNKGSKSGAADSPRIKKRK